MNEDKAPFLFVAGIALLLGLSMGYVLGNWQSASRTVEQGPKISALGTELIEKPRDPKRVSSDLASAFTFPAKPPAPLASSTSSCKPLGDGSNGTARSRPQIPADWPRGKRIVMHVTSPLAQSHVVACDLLVPAWNYFNRGHHVTIVMDGEAVTAFRQDGTGKTPLDRVAILRSDLDDLAPLLEVPLSAVPKNFGELYRILAREGIRIVANEDVIRAFQIGPGELDPVITVVSGAEVHTIITNLDAFLPYSG